jgi:UDP-glucuronate 4-epimerase
MGFERVIVTGAAGFIGSHLCEALVGEGRSVIGIDNFASNYAEANKRQNLVSLTGNRRFTLVQADVGSKQIQHVVSSTRPDVIVHLAATPGVRPSIDHVLEYIDNNVRGTANLLSSAVTSSVQKVIFASSSSVYGQGLTVASREEDSLHPLSPYAATKVSGEALCQSFVACHDISITCLRFFTVYGPRQRPDMGIHTAARCISSGSPFRMNGDGRSSRDYSYIYDIVSGICASLENDQRFAVYNLGSGRPIELGTMIRTVAEALGREAQLESIDITGAEPTRTFADIRKAANELGYKRTVDFREGVGRFIDWFTEMQEVGLI